MKRKRQVKEVTYDKLVEDLEKAKVKFAIQLKKLRKNCKHAFKRQSEYQETYYTCTKCYEHRTV
jgi:hypothetical protein